MSQRSDLVSLEDQQSKEDNFNIEDKNLKEGGDFDGTASAPKSTKQKAKQLNLAPFEPITNEHMLSNKSLSKKSKKGYDHGIHADFDNTFKTENDIVNNQFGNSLNSAAGSIIISSNANNTNQKDKTYLKSVLPTNSQLSYAQQERESQEENDEDYGADDDTDRQNMEDRRLDIEYVIQQNANAEKIYESTDDDDEEAKAFFEQRPTDQSNLNTQDIENSSNLQSHLLSKETGSEHLASHKKSIRSERIIFHDDQRQNQRRKQDQGNRMEGPSKSQKRQKNGNVSRRRSHGPTNSAMHGSNQGQNKKLKVQQQWSVYLHNNPQANLMPCNRPVVRSVGNTNHQSTKKNADNQQNIVLDHSNNSLVQRGLKGKNSQRGHQKNNQNSKNADFMLPPIPLNGNNKPFQNH